MSDTFTIASTLVQQFVPGFFTCFSYDDIDVTSEVLPVAHKLVQCLPMFTKDSKLMTYDEKLLFEWLWSSLFERMKYPTDFTFDCLDYKNDENAEEELFCRQKLRKFYVFLVKKIPPAAVVTALCQIFASLGRTLGKQYIL